MGPNPNQVQITYLGPPIAFPAGDTIAVVTTVTSSQVGAGTVSLQAPADRYVGLIASRNWMDAVNEYQKAVACVQPARPVAH